MANIYAKDPVNTIPGDRKGSEVTSTYDSGSGRTALDVSLISGGASNVDTEGDSAPSDAGLFGGIAALVQRAANAAGDLVAMTVNAYGELVLASYDWASNLLRVQEQNPLSEQYTPSELVDDTSIAADTYDYILTQDGYKAFSLDFNLDAGAGGTVDLKVYASNDDAASPDWREITGSGVDGSDASTGNTWQSTGTAVAGTLSWDNLNFKKVKVEVVVATQPADAVKIIARQRAL